MQALAALQAQLSAGARPGTSYTPAPAVSMTPQDVQAMIDASLSRALAPVASPLAQFDSIFQRALPADDFAAFTGYVQRGAPGFGELLKSDKLDPIAQLLWETIKENVK
jgi:hypothetical protein